MNIGYAASSEWTLASTVNTVPVLVEATSVEENKISKEAGGWERQRGRQTDQSCHQCYEGIEEGSEIGNSRGGGDLIR